MTAYFLFDDHGPATAVSRLSGDYWLEGVALGMAAELGRLGGNGRFDWKIADGYVYCAVEGDPFARPTGMTDLRDRWERVLWPELQDAYAAIDAASLDGPDAAGVWDAQWSRLERLWEIHFEVAFGAYRPIERLGEIYEALGIGTAAQAAALLDGCCETTRALDRDLRALTEAARTGENALRSALPAFLRAHGHMGAGGMLDEAPWDEDPEPLLALVRQRIASDTPGSDARLRAGALADEARAKLDDADRTTFDEALAHARRDGPLQEEHATWIDAMLGQRMRRLALRAGARLLREDVLDDARDVVHLHRAEVSSALSRPSDLRALVDERREELVAQRRARPPRILGGEPPKPAEAPEDGVLHGTPVSAGTGAGPARIVLSGADFTKVAPGDVLVCKGTNPSYTPVMAIAAAIVSSIGDVHSHAAIESRELGVPAVVGVAHACELIADGQTVEVDGGTGVVRLLPQRSGEEDG